MAHSVNVGYREFIFYSAAANTLLFMMVFISTQTLINSLGINASRATTAVLSAGMNFVIKEGAGQVGGIIFMKMFEKTISGYQKQWRVMSFVLLSFGLVLEVVTLGYPQHFLFLASSAAICACLTSQIDCS